MSKINSGDVVRVHYEGRLEDGTVFDSSAEREPLEFEAGSTQLIPGFSSAVVGMEVGEKKTVTLEPSEAYGDVRPEMLQRVAVNELPDGVKIGDQLVAHAGEQTIPVKVTEMTGEEAVLDANHPLAGKTLIFDIEVVA
jgi:FKBP-type peptidyl-prolyl cis-trans isomerase 2